MPGGIAPPDLRQISADVPESGPANNSSHFCPLGVTLKASQLFGFTVRRPLSMAPAASSVTRPSCTAASIILFDSFERVVVTFARLPTLAPAVSGISPIFPRPNAAPAGSQLRGSATKV